jgi:hypothetical protein
VAMKTFPELRALRTFTSEARSLGHGMRAESRYQSRIRCYGCRGAGGALPGEIKTPPQADGETATQRRPGSSHGEWKVHHIALSREGRWLALTPEKGAILLYDLHRADPDDPSRADGTPVAALGEVDAN